MTSTRAIGMRKYHFESPTLKIGKTYWRFVIFDSRYGGYSTDYEWLNTGYDREGVWYPSEDRKGYDHNDGMYAGLPKTLRKFWEQYGHEYEALQTRRADKAVAEAPDDADLESVRRCAS